jgi:transposase
MEATMLGRQERWQEDLFVAAPLRELIPDDHILKRIDRILDLAWLRKEVEACYDTALGRPGIDPEAALRLMLAGLFLGIAHDRKLMREAQVNIAIRWFAGYRLTETLPSHSSLTRIRQRWGVERFEMIFRKTVQQCIEAGLVRGDLVHVDATLIRADVSWDSIVERHLDEVKRVNDEGSDDDPPSKDDGNDSSSSRPVSRTKQVKKISTTDPDATMATSSNRFHMEPSYKQHTAVDDKAGVIVDVHVTTGEHSEGKELEGQLDRVERATGRKIQTVTADAGYAHGANYAMLEARETEAVIPPQRTATRKGRMPARRFKYDEKHQTVRCPKGKVLNRSGRDGQDQGWVYRAKVRDCRACELRPRCMAPSAKVRLIRIGDSHASLLRARRSHARWDARTKMLYSRHRWRAEGAHGEAKAQHGLGRATRRGTANVRIQAYLTAAVQNLKRIANALSHALRDWAWCERFTTNRSTDRLSTLSAIKFFARTDTALQAA